MNPELILHPVGIGLAGVFIISMGALFLWMFRVPPYLTHDVAVVRRSVKGIRKILVPVLADPYSQRGVELACRLGQEQQAELVLAYVFEVPLISPLNASMPEEEARAEQALTEAEDIVKLHDLKYQKRTRAARRAADAIIDIAREEEADLIVVGLIPKQRPSGAAIGATTDWLLRHPPCEIIVDRVPTVEVS